jgi:arylsulfatase A-like enzyme
VAAVLLSALLVGAPAPRLPKPALVVVLTVDQLAAFYLERHGTELQGGLARLLRGGAVFGQAMQDHAITETAPGHAVILSGRYPVHTGITSNLFGVEDKEAPLLEAAGPGASPRRFQGSTLVDWLQRAEPKARVLSVSAKDRAAILPVGRSKAAVFWYVTDGRFTTSRYYADTLPTWVRTFNARDLPRRTAGTAWTLLRPADTYAEPDAVAYEANGSADNVFPHRIPADSAAAASYVRATPFIDGVTLDLALAGVEAMQLGRGPATDLLAVSLSATDVIGHRYGPDSREAHDNLLQLDRSLGRFLDSLFVLRDSTRIIVALTADHGVAAFPEHSAAFGTEGGPVHVTLEGPMDSLQTWLASRGVKQPAIFLENGALLANRTALAVAKISADDVARRFVALSAGQPGVQRAATMEMLAASDTLRDVAARRWLHMFAPGGIALAAVTLEPGSVWGTRGAAEHGTPHAYDVDVPLVLMGPGVRAGRYGAPVRITDLAPTLAVLMGVKPTERIDGRVLSEAIARPPR